MNYVQPFTLGDYLFVELLSTTPPYVIHRAIRMTDAQFSYFHTFKNVNPEVPDARKYSRDLQVEAETLEEIRQPSVPQLCDFGTVGGHSYLVYRYIWGRSLLQILRALKAHRKRLSEDYAVHIAHEVLKAMNQVHAIRGERFPNGILHNSLSPRNIIISYSGEVHLVDFGHRTPNLTGENLKALEFRNLSYLSPEQVNRGNLTHRSDLFTVGSVFYEMLTGTPPFMEKSAAKVLNRIARCSYQAPEHVNPLISREISAFLAKALSAYPNDRFVSAGEMALELQKYLRRNHGGFTAGKVRKLMGNLFGAEIREDVAFFQKLENSVERRYRPLVRSIPPALINELGDSVVPHEEASQPPEPVGFLTNPGEESIRGTVTYTVDEFRRRQVDRRPGGDSFFEVEDTILVPAPREPNIIQDKPAQPRPVRFRPSTLALLRLRLR